ncbi:hypothetical protein P43SY_010789 [Pythium insidiosum]|uniref:Uncharacterized protein n=1 Tax=Pythium insidiosum TaxID=114742 RepID=A0AAD5LZ19_PYTIN|nr:hypothetical protein P43SY_010789 [Pythium insidiosum]
MIDHQQIGQISKGRGGDLCVKVKTRAACEQLAGQEVKILGNKFKFQDFDILADRFFIDVSSVDSDFDDAFMLRRLFELGAEPIYGTFRDVNLEAAMTTATWRVYFRANRCPPALVVGGQPCDQLLFDGRLYPVQAKDAAFPSQRRGFGQRSTHVLDLSPPISSSRSPSASPHPAASESKRSYASVVRNGKPAPQKPSATAPAGPADDSMSVLSLSTNVGSVVSPPSSPRTTHTQLAITDGSRNSTSSGMRKAKRQRCAEDFATHG